MKVKNPHIYRLLSAFLSVILAVSLTVPAQAQSVLNLPSPGKMITTTQSFIPPIVRGITLYPDNPFRFDFIIDAGDNKLQGEDFNKESSKLIKYFLASLTVPEKEMWVNLSPYEKDRIIADGLGLTEMGRDLLAQDYILKQLTASLVFPENEIGKEFWRRVYAKAQEKYGTSEIPMNTFNKIWIVPDKANVYVNGSSVFVAESHLKVMLEEDYLALDSNIGSAEHGLGKMTKDDIEVISGVSSEIVREILIPEIEKEVNSGEHFSILRQIYNSMILATWYKQNLKNSLLGQVYVDKSKSKGIDLKDKDVNQQIFDQYVKAFEKGIFDFIREDYDEVTQKIIPRKYFSGGLDLSVSKSLGEESAGGTIGETLKDRPMNTVSFYLDTVKNTDEFRRIINDLVRSENVPELSEGATEDEIMEYVLNHLITNDLVSDQTEARGDVQVFVIEDEGKNTRLGQALQNHFMERKRGAQVINFPGTDGVWKILGFESGISGQLVIEMEEVRRRKLGDHWIVAMVGARGEQLPEGFMEEVQKANAGRDDISRASVASLGMGVLERQLKAIAENPLTPMKAVHIPKVIEKVQSGEITLSGENIDIFVLNDEGDIEKIGLIDSGIAHLYFDRNGNVLKTKENKHAQQLFHLSAAVFIRTSDHRYVIIQKAKKKKYSLVAEHIPAGYTARRAILKGIVEELGFPEDYVLTEGNLSLIATEGAFETADPKHNVNRSFFIYELTERGERMVKDSRNKMKKELKKLGRKAFEQKLKEARIAHDGGGEIKDIKFVHEEELLHRSKKRGLAFSGLLAQALGNEIIITELEVDRAQLSSSPGGIDLNPSVLNLQTEGEGINISFPMEESSLQNLQIDGFVPVIFQIVPTTNLPLLLGESMSEEAEGQLVLTQ